MHYNTKRIAKVETEKFWLDYRLADLIEICAKKHNTSKNKIFEQAILEYCYSLKFTFDIKREVRRKYLIKPSTLDLLEKHSEKYNIPKARLVNKALKFYLMERFKKRQKQKTLFSRKDFRHV